MKDLSLSEDECNRMRYNQHFSIDKISERYLEYNPDNVAKMVGILIKNRKKSNKQITVTMTSCKRYDLFYKTVSSFINCCLDLELIDEWIVVDDQSSNEDKLKMMTDFPFIKYIWKTKENKGHARSMNILRELVKTPFTFHMEDDWLFFRQEKYLSTCLNIINSQEHYGQCLLNRLYTERAQCYDIFGGIKKNYNNTRYYEHEFYTGNELEKFTIQNRNKKTCAYWPHYSLRVGMMKTIVWKKVGEYNENAEHFEMEYAYRYVNNGYVTTYLDNTNCLHIGRCTFERNSDKLNAYDLNKESQFGNPVKNNNVLESLGLTEEEEKISSVYTNDDQQINEISHTIKSDRLELLNTTEYDTKYKLKTYVLNLERRPDRLKKFIIENHDHIEKLQYQVFKAIDGNQIVSKPKTLKLFETGDYKYRKGIMGCASSHIKMWHELIVSDIDVMLVLEDDVTLSSNFINKLISLLKKLPPDNWNILFLGHFLYPHFRKESDSDQDVMPSLEKWDKNRCMKESMGGTIGYIIHKRGAVKMFKHVHDNGVYNAIDWVMFKTADENNIYYSYPHIVFSECVTNEIKPDSDIQYDVNSLCPDDNSRISLELKYWKEKNVSIKCTDAVPSRDELLTRVHFIKTDDYMDLVRKFEKLPVQFYTINKGKYMVVVPHTKITVEIQGEVVFDGGYLNVDNPV
jgi:GR25 family glycosyltransferase involved in LPS biosynthesis